MDLRLLGVVLKHEKFSNIASSILPLVWTGFTIMFVSGFLLFWSEAAKSYGNVAFRIKLVLLLLAGLNPLIFHSTIYRTVDSWDDAPVAPVPARISAFCSRALGRNHRRGPGDCLRPLTFIPQQFHAKHSLVPFWQTSSATARQTL
jgi:ABC-type uncharacterized transport system permease subunit